MLSGMLDVRRANKAKLSHFRDPPWLRSTPIPYYEIYFMRPSWFVFKQIYTQIHNNVAIPFKVSLQLFEFCTKTVLR